MTRTIRLLENMRAPVYIPYYLAQARGAFAAEGLDVDIGLSPAPTRTPEALLEGEADVSWGGPMRVMMHHDRDPLCPLVCFCLVVGREPFTLVGREPRPGFRFSDLAGMRVATVSEVPTPWMCFQEDLRRAGIDPASLDRIPDGTMAGNIEALRRGDCDVVQLFEPWLDVALETADAHVWHRFADRGPVAYTTFYTTARFAAQEHAACRAMARAMERTLAALAVEPETGIAAEVRSFFPDLKEAVVARIIARYRASGVWTRTTELGVEAMVRLKLGLISGGLISSDVPCERLIAPKLADIPPPDRPAPS